MSWKDETMKDKFLHALHKRRKVEVVFFSKEDNGYLTRTCAPMDYGPSRRSKDKTPRYHLWDYTSDTGPHTLSISEEHIKELKVLEEEFDPSDFITWDLNESPWFTERDWGAYS